MTTPPTINAADELRSLADKLGPPSWARKFRDEWTPTEQAAFERCSDWKILEDWIFWVMHEPVQIDVVDEWRVGEHHFWRERRTHGEYVEESVHEGVINMSDELYGEVCYPGPRRDAYAREHPYTATPSERARLDLELSPERSAAPRL
jgi:hypothetical protein